MKISIAQLNPIIGDIDGNYKKILQTLSLDEAVGSDLVVFPELSLTGYPLRDLLERPRFIERVQKAIDDLCSTHRIPFPQIPTIMIVSLFFFTVMVTIASTLYAVLAEQSIAFSSA